MKILSSVALILCVLAASSALQAVDNGELKKIEGRFERKFQDAAGATFHAVNEMIGDKSTVTTFDDARKIVEAHTATIKVDKQGPVRVLTFCDLVVTAGPQTGHTQAHATSYIYRLEEGTFTEVWGLMEGDKSPPQIFSWRRIKEGRKVGIHRLLFWVLQSGKPEPTPEKLTWSAKREIAGHHH